MKAGCGSHGLITARRLTNDGEASIFAEDLGNALAKERIVIHQQNTDQHWLTKSYEVSLVDSGSLSDS